ncbi:MAG: exodeoxyribonuclease VII large subunit [Oscillospiraceae bacterium]|nr:exodeoxyribonuclease VII large subunit [Oscillospiraceae bacterium]
MSQQILSITQINEYIRTLMDGDRLLCGVAVRGEISNYKVYPSGHHYFTLKDDGAALKCVMFRGNATKLRFRPDNGMQVVAMGKISVYPRDGAYQLYCTGLILDGVGDLYAAFEQLKTKLAAEGLFDPAYKKPIPQFPKTIGIVTSSAGAAVHDMLRILNKRFPLTKVRLLPVRVQGAEAPEEIAAAIGYANHHKLADLLIVGRGGGSIEDLWAFNDERVAYAIYRSEIPIISAVGHEPDVTISDFVADLRAATPSNAAELAVPDQDALRQVLDSMSASMSTALERQLKALQQRLKMLSESPALQSPQGYLEQRSKSVELLKNRLISAQRTVLNRHNQHYLTLAAKLDALSPLKVLTRGYAMVQDADGEVIRSVKQTTTGGTVEITLRDGTVSANVTRNKENAL